MRSMSVRPEMVQTLSTNIRQGSGNIQKELDQLDQQVKALIESWDGAAQEAYYQAQSQWTTKLTEINTLLEQIAQRTSQIGEGYVSTDQAAASRFPG